MTPAIKLLKRYHAKFQVHSYSHDPRSPSYGLEAAEKLAVEPARVFKTLLAQAETHELVVAVLPVNSTLNLKQLAQVAGVKKLVMADPLIAQRATGYLVGGISPLGQKRRLRTFVDSRGQSYSSIFISAGRRGLEVELQAQTLVQLTAALWVPLTADFRT